MLSENRVGSANHHGLFHAISVDRQAPVRLFRAMQGSSEMDGQLVSVCSCFLDCHCRSRGGDVSRIQGPCLLRWDPKAETATKYSRMWSSRVRSSWPPLPPSLLKSGGLQRGCGGQTPLGQKPSASLKQSCPFHHGFGKPPLTGAPASHLHPKGLHPGGHLSPDSAQAENSQGLPAQLRSHELQPSRQRSQSRHQAGALGAEPDGRGEARHSPSSAPTCRPSSKPSPGESACEDKHRLGVTRGEQAPGGAARPDVESGRRFRFRPSLWGINLRDWANKTPQPTLRGLQGGRRGALRDSDGIKYSASSERFIFLFHPGPQPATSPKPGDS